MKEQSKEHKFGDIVLAPALKKDIEKIDIAMNRVAVRVAKRKRVLLQEYLAQGDTSKSHLQKEVHLFYDDFSDNNHLHYRRWYLQGMWSYGSIQIGPLFSWIHVSKKKENQKTKMAGLTLQKNDWHGALFYDTLLHAAGFEIGARLFLHRITLSKENLAIQRQELCAIKRSLYRLAISRYLSMEQGRELWYEVAFDRIGANRSFTPQFDYIFATYKMDEVLIHAALSGWYFFNRLNHRCYYSPKKADDTLLGLRLTRPILQHSRLMLKGAIGYSAFDRVMLYDYGIWAQGEVDLLRYKVGCDLGNSVSHDQVSGYRSRSCHFEIGRVW